jgi:glutaredoxin
MHILIGLLEDRGMRAQGWSRTVRGAALLLLAAAMVAGTTASAEIYRWVDEQGRVHFTDKKPSGGEGETVDTPATNSDSAPSTADRRQRADDTARQPAVVMYATEWCPYCKKARRYFEANGIDYTEYDVEKDRKGKRDYERMGEPGVPVILVGDLKMTGFSPGSFERIYRQATDR